MCLVTLFAGMRMVRMSLIWVHLNRYHLTPHTSHLTPHTSHLTPHTSHLTPHTSHLTPHTSHLTPHTSLLQRGVAQVLIVLSVKEPGENWQDERLSLWWL
jgi:hypothetical protein